MLILLSPAKTLDFESPAAPGTATQPVLLDNAQELIDRLQKLNPGEIASLMHISDKLANLNHERYMEWHTPFTKTNARQSIMAFKGDVYTGLEAHQFSATELKFAQQHLRILSGLYGVLRPLDLMQPYRLEMGTKFATARGKDLYQFWGSRITDVLSKQLKALKTDTLLNLASNEYFKAIDTSALHAEIISPGFKDFKNGSYKFMSFYAKTARGQMAAWVIRKGITDPGQLKKFRMAGYRYSAAMSAPNKPMFIRDEVPTAR